jgi:putative endonuclease
MRWPRHGSIDRPTEAPRDGAAPGLPAIAPERIERLALGRKGERRARWFYRLRGFRILASNLRIAGGELDLVVRRGTLLVVAEVKTRQSLAAGHGVEAVDRAKRRQLVRLGGAYLARLGDRRVELRYDIVSLFWTGRRFVVDHFPDAFRTMSDPAAPWRWLV